MYVVIGLHFQTKIWVGVYPASSGWLEQALIKRPRLQDLIKTTKPNTYHLQELNLKQRHTSKTEKIEKDNMEVTEYIWFFQRQTAK